MYTECNRNVQTRKYLRANFRYLTATLKKHGYEKNNRCGYPIGCSYPPDWGERTMSLEEQIKQFLRKNMTFHFMPAIWFDDWGFGMTESIRVGKNGGECLSHVPRKLLVK